MTRRVLGVSLAIWLVLSASLWGTGWDPDVFVLGGILVSGGVVLVVVVGLIVEVRPPVWPDPDSEADFVAPDHERVNLLLGDLDGSGRVDTTRMRTTLLRVVDQRLLDRHGIERVAQPGAANELLTPRLLRLVDGPTSRLASVRELRSILSDLEEL